MNRRTFLGTAAAATAALAGCAGGNGGGGGDDGESPATTATPTPAPTATPTATETATAVPAQEKFPDYRWDVLEDADPVATETVTMKNFEFEPLVAQVTPGTDVTFVNEDSTAHTVTIPELRVDESVGGGAKTTVSFDRVGTYDYVCTLHPPKMLGRVVVGEETPAPTATETPTPTPQQAAATVVARDNSFDPIRASVDPGATVEWENRETGTYTSHTVTATRFHDVAKVKQWDLDESFEKGGTIAHAFEDPGVYEYYCTIHGKETMCGAVLVGDVSLDRELPCEDGDGGGY